MIHYHGIPYRKQTPQAKFFTQFYIYFIYSLQSQKDLRLNSNFLFYPLYYKNPLKKKLTMPNTGKDREQLKRSYIIGWKQNDTSPLYKRLAYDPARKKKKKRHTSTQKPYMNVYCSFICNCPKAGNNPKWRTPFSIQWMNGKIIVHLHCRILLSDL